MAQRIKDKRFNCEDCGEVEGNMYWSNLEDEMMVSCSKCGGFLQVYDRQMYYTGITKEAER